MTITTNIMNTDHVKELLHKAAGLDKETGSTRNKQIMHRLLTDIYTMIEELDITPEEFWQGVNYLNELGANGEAVLLAPGLGFDHFLDLREDAKDALAGELGGTPRTIEGPLYVEGAPLSEGEARMDDGQSPGQEMWLHGQVLDEAGNPLADAIVDIWHADKKGGYSHFDPTQSEFNLRRRIKTDSEGKYRARSIVPSGYGCPPGGSTMKVLESLGRHGNRPAHIHYFVSKPGYKHLTTQINLAGDEYTYDDFAFATRDELVVEAVEVTDSKRITEKGFKDNYLDVEFNISLMQTSDDEKQSKHARARAAASQA